MPNHDNTIRIPWTGTRGEGTAQWKACEQVWDVAVPLKAPENVACRLEFGPPLVCDAFRKVFRHAGNMHIQGAFELVLK